MSGGTVEIDVTEQRDAWALRSRLAGSAAGLEHPGGDGSAFGGSTSRTLGFFDVAIARTWRGTGGSFTATLGGDETAGRSFDQGFNRASARSGFTIRGAGIPNLSGSALYGAVSRGSSLFEDFTVGGGLSPLLGRELTTQWVSMPALPRGVAGGPAVFVYRAALDVQPLSWYLWSASTAGMGERFSVWHRVIGLEYVESIARIPLAGTPAARVQVGVGKSLDPPYRGKTRLYLSLVLNP
jgi:hypothetical protein